MATKRFASIENFRNSGKSMMNGYIRFLSDSDVVKYKEILADCTLCNKEEPFAVTVFGDIIAMDEEGFIVLMRLVDGVRSVICAEAELFFVLWEDTEYQKDYFDVVTYEYAREKLGALSEDESYVFEPIPALGGGKKKEDIAKGKTIEYLKILVSFVEWKE